MVVTEFFSIFETLTTLNSPTFPTLTIPEISDNIETPFGILASNSSITLGRPEVMSSPAIPPVWNVLIVNCVPGSPIDWAAIIPTASPISAGSPVAKEDP